MPSISGTSPEGFAWSVDGTQLAFLWNDEGLRFRDIWSYSPATGEKRQLTRLVEERPTDSEHWGISEVVWLTASDRLAFVLDGKLYSLNSGDNPSLLDAARGNVSNLQVSPDGQRLAFIADDAVWVKDIGADSPSRRVAGGEAPRTSIDDYEWSQDGTRIAYVRIDNRNVRQIDIYYHSGGDIEAGLHRTTRAFPGDETPKLRVGVVDLENGRTRWFERPDEQHPVWGFGLSGDGSRLFIDSSDFLIKHRTIYVYEVETGKKEVFFQSSDPNKVSPAWSTAWAPDDAGLIILSDHDGFFHLYHQTKPKEAARQLTTGRWEIASFEVDPKRKKIYFLANKSHAAELRPYSVSLTGGSLLQLSELPGTHTVVFSPDFNFVADRFSSDTAPPELYVDSLSDNGPAQRVTKSPSPEFYQLKLPDVSYVQFKSHVDGTPLLGRLSLPQNLTANRRRPLLMGSIYPNSVRNRWGAGNAIPVWGLDQHFVEQGYIVMKVDVRGSWGYGKEIRQGLFSDYGGIDTDDIESGVRHLIDTGYADPERVGIWGWSYGGLMTMMSLFNKPDLYAAGIADAPATNVAHAFPEQMWVMGRPEGEDFPERYERMSALYHTAKLTKPVMITHATKDAVVLYGDTIALAERLIANGKQFELVSLPGSSHIWALDSLDQQIFGYRKMVDFFDRHLMCGSGSTCN